MPDWPSQITREKWRSHNARVSAGDLVKRLGPKVATRAARDLPFCGTAADVFGLDPSQIGLVVN